MGIFGKSRAGFAPMLALVMVIVLAVAVSACGGGDSSTSTSAVGTVSSDAGQASGTTIGSATTGSLSLHDRIQQEQTGSTPTASVTTAGGQTTTTVAGETTTTSRNPMTTGNPTGTTAKSTTTTKPTATTAKPTTTTAKGPIVLTVVGPSGTEQLSMANLKAMWATSGYGGWKNQLGNITPPVSWKGVALANLMDLVGGGSSVVVTASDGYEQSLSAGELSGAVTTYDPATGEQIIGINGSIVVVVAYAKGGSAISGEEGPLRVAFVSPAKDQVTDSAMWVRMVNRITVR